MIHDEVIAEMFEEFSLADKKKYTDLFLHSFSTGFVDISIQVYSLMRTYHRHSFSQIFIPDIEDRFKRERLRVKEFKRPVLERTYITFKDMEDSKKEKILEAPHTPCHICSSYFKNYSLIEEREFRFTATDIYKMLEVLRRANEFKSVLEIDSDNFLILIHIMQEIELSKPSEGIRDVFKRIKKSTFYNQWKKRIVENNSDSSYLEVSLQTVLEILGWIGVLHTEKHKGAFYEFVNYGNSPRSSRSSDWDYPVDFWRGKDGIDWGAFNYWFDTYPVLENISKVKSVK